MYLISKNLYQRWGEEWKLHKRFRHRSKIRKGNCFQFIRRVQVLPQLSLRAIVIKDNQNFLRVKLTGWAKVEIEWPPTIPWDSWIISSREEEYTP